MNYSTAIFLVNNDVRAVQVSYDVDKDGKGTGNFTTLKTFDPTLSVGDFVVIPTDTRHKMTVCRVEKVDVEIDLDSDVQVGWVVGRVNRRDYGRITDQEAAMIDTMKSAEVRSKKEAMAAKLIADNPAIQGLALVNATAALAAPPPPSAYGGETIQDAAPQPAVPAEPAEEYVPPRGRDKNERARPASEDDVEF